MLGLKDARGPAAFGLELAAGLTPCAVDPLSERHGRARFKSPGVPRLYDGSVDPVAIAAAVGLEPRDVGFGRHHPSCHGVALPMTFAPIASIEALGRIKIDQTMLAAATAAEHRALYAYAPVPGGGLNFRARMFAPDLGVAEDPATGSAAAAFAGVLMQFEKLGEGIHEAELHQGVEMGRPSRIELQMDIRSGAIASVEIGGEAVIVAEGVLHV
jgi:trans-2,3-dihydro-3-hydroxyanthranilate isomerase